jgi:hypothetical protein
MQTLGTQWGREHIGPDFWVRLWERQLDFAAGPIVCDDVRFANEFAAVRRQGGVVLRVMRPGAIRDGHASERDWRRVFPDATIINDGTVAELEGEVLECLHCLSTSGPAQPGSPSNRADCSLTQWGSANPPKLLQQRTCLENRASQ